MYVAVVFVKSIKFEYRQASLTKAPAKKFIRNTIDRVGQHNAVWRIWNRGWIDSSSDEAPLLITNPEGNGGIITY